jgi:SAM-dependent methyltransferase
MNCPICSNSNQSSAKTTNTTPSQLYHTNTDRDNQRYYRCPECHSVAMHPQHYPTPEEEKTRYLTHNNDVDDPGYQNFVRPVIQAVTTHIQTHQHGLDYGAGTGPVITKLLLEKDYSMTTYDPFFIPNHEALSATYDFIVCCEVAEHFHDPQREFARFHKLLNLGGLLIIKTELLTPNIDFRNWYYINDPTHTLFYSPEGMRRILNQHGFQSLDISPRLVIAKKCNANLKYSS